MTTTDTRRRNTSWILGASGHLGVTVQDVACELGISYASAHVRLAKAVSLGQAVKLDEKHPHRGLNGWPAFVYVGKKHTNKDGTP